MVSTTQKLMERGLAGDVPAFLKTNVHYETIVGSHAFGVADTSVRKKVPDYDVYGFAIPPKEFIFKSLTGWIPGFGPEPPGFEQWHKHHIRESDVGAGDKQWDLQIFSLVRFFELCRENNPNILDCLFTPEHCVLHCTHVGRIVRDNRKLFLSKLCWKKYRGYALAQLKKLNDKVPIGGRAEIVAKHGYDVKFAYHILRLFDEAEQIMLEGDLDLQRAREAMKSVRRGDWKLDDLKAWVIEKERALESIYVTCKLPDHPPLEPLRRLLLHCLEEHYGTLQDCVVEPNWAEQGLKQIDSILGSLRAKMYSNFREY